MKRPSIGRDDCRVRPSRAAGMTVGVAFVLLGLTACIAGPGATIPVPTWPVSPELLPAATSGAADAKVTCGGRPFPASGLEAPPARRRHPAPSSTPCAPPSPSSAPSSRAPPTGRGEWPVATRRARSSWPEPMPSALPAGSRSRWSPRRVAGSRWAWDSATRTSSCRRSSDRRPGRSTRRSRHQRRTRPSCTSSSGSEHVRAAHPRPDGCPLRSSNPPPRP